MNNLGKCLLFYLKYSAEVERIYEAENDADNLDTDGFPGTDVQEKVVKVHDAACREVAELLKECGRKVVEHFGAISAIKQSKVNPESWRISYRVWPKRGRKNFNLGVYVDSEKAEIVSWLWCRGGRQSEFEAEQLLGNKYTKIERGTDCDETSGVVVLGRTKINIPEDLNDSVASAPLISAVENVFNLFIEEDVKGLARISGMRS
jgi:hypothetical protein